MFNSDVKVGDKLYLHNTFARHGEKPIKELTVSRIGRKYIFCRERYSNHDDYKIDVNTGQNVNDDRRRDTVYNSIEEIKNHVILHKMAYQADRWMRDIDDEEMYKLYLQFKDIIDKYIDIDEINKNYTL